jgi:hypothetical protein
MGGHCIILLYNYPIAMSELVAQLLDLDAATMEILSWSYIVHVYHDQFH